MARRGGAFVPLGELTDASLVAPEVAKAIGVVETGPDLTGRIAGQLAGRRALIVLDTFEHLAAAVPVVYALAQRCPQTILLVTSRSALRLRGEHEFPVPPLGLPPDGEVSPAEVTCRPATALFWERARAVRRDLVLDAATAALVTVICRKLDGLPLAIELAAARVKHLPLEAIRDQLGQRLRLLVGGPRDLPVRQRAISDTVAWSHDLLGGREQTLLRRLSVFAGGWSLDAVAPVTGGAPADALPGVSVLVDHSLVALDHTRREPRYDMLDVVREYGAARLAAAGEVREVERRHARHFLALAEAAEPHLVRTDHADLVPAPGRRPRQPPARAGLDDRLRRPGCGTALQRGALALLAAPGRARRRPALGGSGAGCRRFVEPVAAREGAVCGLGAGVPAG